MTYFGFWLSALDNNNSITFYQGGSELFTFSAAAARTFINGLPNRNAYFGNPNSQFAGQNSVSPMLISTFMRAAERSLTGWFSSRGHLVGWKATIILSVAGHG